MFLGYPQVISTRNFNASGAINCPSSEEADEYNVQFQAAHPGSPLDQDSTSAQWTRFQVFHSDLDDPQAHRSYLGDYKADNVQKYLDGLERLCRDLTLQHHQLRTFWCDLLKTRPFADFVRLRKQISHQVFQKEDSQLAFLKKYPTFAIALQINHKDRVRALDFPPQKALSFLEKLTGTALIQSEIVEEGYHNMYLNSSEIVDPMLTTLAKHASDWSPLTYSAPYTSLTGPSIVVEAGMRRLHMCPPAQLNRIPAAIHIRL
ncbi:hypothetical protein PCASD_03119 [Puccinia coronata f. sp. avenae]|uniref:Uncharacterized protein n=1 Tax=Puccinia coronata f. sp. avenae TaxID=200324 RepID=A0A2N5V5V0_9BASI|nr:hypothetical protein PCASD_03119 [Puccinia coronata f. sp. avenae]